MVQYFFQAAAEEIAEEVEVIAEAAAPVNDKLISQSLQITGIGMLILFASLFVLWGVMELLVRVVKDAPKSDEEDEEVSADIAEDQDDDLKLKAAAAAAAYAIAKK